MYSQQVNLKAEDGGVNFQAENVSGVVNASGNSVHLYTSDSALTTGNIDSSGDPTISSQSNITIDGSISATDGANLAIVSGGSIFSAKGAQLDTRDTDAGGGNGGNLSLIAGANFTVDGSGNLNLTDSANAGKGSTIGGILDLSGAFGGTGATSLITTAGTGATGNAGYVQMVAYAGTGPNTGIIQMPTGVTIDASSAGGQRGDVSIISANNGQAMRTSDVIGNHISMLAFTPSVGSGMSFDTTGTASNGINSFTTSGTTKTGAIITGNLSATSDINLNGGAIFIVGNVSANGAGGQAGGASLDGGAGHVTNISGLLQISIQGNISAVGGGGAGSGSSTPGQDGGKGGNGGQITIIKSGSTPLGTTITGNIDVSGGGGGGGAGGSETTAATNGGAGGAAGSFKFVADGGLSLVGTVYGYDGGAGGNGGSSVGGVGAGGGGGSARGGAGGGGGGGTGNNSSDFAAGGGGGFSLVSGSGGGGGGVFGSASGGTLSTGGNGGSAVGNGAGGAGDVVGGIGIGSAGGAGGGLSGTAPGGAGSTVITQGGNGGQTNVSGQGVGQSGAGAAVVTGHGLIDISSASLIGGPGSAPMKFESGALKITLDSGMPGGGPFIVTDFAGVPLNLISASLNSAPGVVNFTLTTSQNAGTTGADGTVNILGNVTPSNFTLKTTGDAGPNNINIEAAVGGGSFSGVNLTSNGGSVTTSGGGIINSVSATINATGAINVTTNDSSVTASSTNGNVVVNQGTQPLSVSASAGSGGSITVNSQNQITAGAMTATGGIINLSPSGGNFGIIVQGQLSTGTSTGSITLSPSGTGSITEFVGSTAVMISNSISLLTNSSIGTPTAPVLTNATNSGTINLTTGATGSAYLSDSSTGVITINATSSSTGTLSVVSQGSQLDIPQASYATLVANAPNGAVNVTSTSASTISGAAGTSFNLTDTISGAPVVVNGPLLASSVTIQAANASSLSINGSLGSSSATVVDLVSGGGISVSAGSAVSAATITLNSATNSVTFGSSASASSLNLTTNSGVVAVASSATSGGTDQVTAGGDLSFIGTFSSTNPVSVLVGGNLTVGSVSNTSSHISGQSLTITGASVTNYGSISSNTALNFLTPSVNNLGSVSAQTVLSFANSAGDLSVSGNSGSYSTAGGTNLSFQASGAVTVSSPSGNPFTGLNQLGNFSVAAGGLFTSPINSVALVPDINGNGGTISISASNVVYNGSATRTGPVVLSANGGTSPGKAGGVVTLNLFGSGASGITVGSSVGNFQISATGANGGQVNITTPGNLTVNTAYMQINAVSTTGSGSTVTLSSGQNLLLNGNLDTHNGSGTYGPITLTSGSAQSFTIDGSKSGTTNGQIGISAGQGIAGSTVTINDAEGVVLGNTDVLYGTQAINIIGNGLTNNGVVSTPALTILASGNGNLTTGATGTYQNLPMQALVLTAGTGNFNISGATPSANQIDITALNGTVSFASSTTALNAATDGSGNGGSISISAQTLTSGALALNAAATTGIGGSVNIALTGTTKLNVDSTDLSINVANAAGQAGGSVSISNGDSISVDCKSLNLGSNFPAGEGANLSLTAGNKLFLMNTQKLPTTVHNLTLVSNSTAAFNLGGAATSGNGIGDDGKTLTADNISITNNGGAIVAGDNNRLVGATVSLAALGNIGQSSQAIVLNTSSLNLTSTTGSAYISLKVNPSTDFVATVANTLSIDSTGSINSNFVVSASSLILSANGINSGSTLNTNATTVSVTSKAGDLSIVDSQSAPITVSALSSPGFAGLESGGDITTSAAISGSTDFVLTSDAGNIIIGNSLTASNTINLNALGAGSIADASQGSNGYLVAAPVMNVITNGGDIGTSTRSFRTSANSLDLSTNLGGDAFVANTNSKSSGSFEVGATVSSLNLTDTNTAGNNKGSILIDGVQADIGDVTISSNERTMQIDAGQSITTINGNITLQNTFSASGKQLPLIQVGDGATIHGSSNGDPSTGNVFIVLGPVPQTANLRPGVAPTGGSPQIIGTVFFGTKSNPNGSITTSAGDLLEGNQRNLAFTTDGLAATQISLGQNVTIIADPPVPIGAPAPILPILAYESPAAGPAHSSGMPSNGGQVPNVTTVTGFGPGFVPSLAVPLPAMPYLFSSAATQTASAESIPAISTSALTAYSRSDLGGISDGFSDLKGRKGVSVDSIKNGKLSASISNLAHQNPGQRSPTSSA